jgi:hypothetical protein
MIVVDCGQACGILVPFQLTSPSAVPTTYAKKGEAKEGAGSSQDTWRRLTATSWNGTSGVAGPRALPATYQSMYASVGPGVSALPCSFLGPGRCPTKLGQNNWRSSSGRERSLMPRENRVLHIGDPAPDFCLRLADGPEVRLSDYRGRQHILLFFLRGTW